MTSEAARRLRQARGTGRVHSAFARTVNLELDGLGAMGWISLHGPGPIPSPFGIACDTLPDLTGLAGAAVRVTTDEVVVGDRLRVGLAGAVLVDSTLPVRTPAPLVGHCLARALAETTDGLLPAVAALLRKEPVPPTVLAQTASPGLADLLATTAARDWRAAVGAACPLIGLGPGLTPSGDDVLVGWLAGLWVEVPDGRRVVATIGRRLLAVALDRTGALSHAFLVAVAAGEASEPVCRFVAVPDDARLRGLLAVGETSGADLLAGYLLARVALSSRASSSRHRDESRGTGEA